MSLVDLTREGDVWLLTMNQGDNRFNDDSLDAWNDALDRIDSITAAAPVFLAGWWLTGRGSGEGLTSDTTELPEVETW